MPPAASQLVDRRSWRVALAAYAVALTTGTHWPRLQLGTPELPAPDKLIHAGAFGVLTLLLWRTGWFRSFRALAIAGVAWCLADEVTQALPGLGRETSWADFAASAIGVAIAVAFLWSLAPVGGAAARLQQARWRWSAERAARRPGVLVSIVLASLAVGAVGCVSAVLFSSRFPVPMPVESGLLGLGIGMVVGAHLALEIGRRLELRRVRERRCYACDAAADGVAFDDRGAGACAACGVALVEGQWIEPASLRRQESQRLLGLSAAMAVGLVLGGFGLYTLAIAVRAVVPPVASVNDWYNGLTDDMRLVIDLGWIAWVLAFAVRAFRTAVARRLDQQHEQCVACGHDVRAAPVQRGRGRCSECGTAFVRLE